MNLFRSAPGSTARLVQYSVLYFGLYAFFGVVVKYFQGPAELGFPGITELEFLVYSTIGSASLCSAAVVALGWWKFEWRARELLFLFLSGTCTAVVIPTTTLMYSLPISVMVAMVLMRGSIIVISRLVDTLLAWQGLSGKKVSWEENAAVLIALAGVGSHLIFARSADFEFLHSPVALGILTAYIVAYAIRIYLMNYFKVTRGPGRSASNLNYFAVEQLSASFWIFGFLAALALAPGLFAGLPESSRGAAEYVYGTLRDPPSAWPWIALFSVPFGVSAFFSVFLFMFEGRTSTFAGLVNRLCSLLAGTASTLLFAIAFGGKWPSPIDWIAFTLILVAVTFLARAEMKHKQARLKPALAK